VTGISADNTTPFPIGLDHLPLIGPTAFTDPLPTILGAPLAASIIDSQAALAALGGCHPGIVKVTHGTGCFWIAQAGQVKDLIALSPYCCWIDPGFFRSPIRSLRRPSAPGQRAVRRSACVDRASATAGSAFLPALASVRFSWRWESFARCLLERRGTARYSAVQPGTKTGAVADDDMN
jgi:hypothetical protein